MPSLTDHLLAKPLYDWPIAGATAVMVWVIGENRKQGLLLGHLPAGTRASFYVTLAGIAGALLGFFIATVSILLSFLDTDRPRLKKALGGNRGALIQPVFFAAIRITAMAIPTLMVLLVVDIRTYATAWMEAVVVVLVMVATLRTGRLIWLIRQLVLIATRDGAEAS